jgi:hypothetical protein
MRFDLTDEEWAILEPVTLLTRLHGPCRVSITTI